MLLLQDVANTVNPIRSMILTTFFSERLFVPVFYFWCHILDIPEVFYQCGRMSWVGCPSKMIWQAYYDRKKICPHWQKTAKLANNIPPFFKTNQFLFIQFFPLGWIKIFPTAKVCTCSTVHNNYFGPLGHIEKLGG